jgi:2-polyprenyl-3-methyl-5-hydroxy-6-metoxy-1,4-benzoquinol methylase
MLRQCFHTVPHEEECFMPIDFHSKNNRFTYAARQAYLSWISTIRNIVDVKGKRVLDMGCGGGIYCKAFA